jgi:hypothetical protein
MKKIIKLTENDLARIVKRVINEQGGMDPKWISLADSNLDFNAKVKSGYGPTSATYVAGNPDGDMVVIIPKGSKFTPSPSGAFLLSQGYLVSKDSLMKNGGLTFQTLFTSPGMVAKALQSGKLNPRKVNIALTNSGTLVYEDGSSLRLLGSGSALSSAVISLFA